jgi:hypothetical protein
VAVLVPELVIGWYARKRILALRSFTTTGSPSTAIRPRPTRRRSARRRTSSCCEHHWLQQVARAPAAVRKPARK